ncbi:MAG: hypothetical protein JWM96_1431 [Alphaproteobacteria bacterium]|nr:hypothetical protein [Alphaproteobacteria bacterium]
MTEPPPFSPVIAMLTIVRSFETDLATALKKLGINTRKYGLLGHINATPDVSFSELARRSRITVQSVHVAVESLIEGGWVEDATASAGTASSLRVTAAGLELLELARAEVVALDAECARQFPELTEGLRASMMRLMS